jgi:hypothetical protein
MIDSFSLHIERNDTTKNLNIWDTLGNDVSSKGKLKFLINALITQIRNDVKEEQLKSINKLFHLETNKIYTNDLKPSIVLDRLLVFNLNAQVVDLFSATHAKSQNSSAIKIKQWVLTQTHLSGSNAIPLKMKPFFDKFGENIAKVLFADNPTSIPMLLSASAATQIAEVFKTH